MNQKQKKERMTEIVAALELLYPEAVCALEYGGEPWRLLVMARLSAQCTDARVNLVCRDLFAVYPTPRALADAPLEDIETRLTMRLPRLMFRYLAMGPSSWVGYSSPLRLRKLS